VPADVCLPVARDPSHQVDLANLEGLVVVFCYPRTGRYYFLPPFCFPHFVRVSVVLTWSGAPDEVVPDSWNAIPGARGCTPQACSFRDHLTELQSLGVSRVYGVSTQSPAYQAEVHERLHLPYDLLSDEKLEFQRALNLPTFEWEGQKVLRRSMIAIQDGKVVKWWYPVFPPDRGVDDLIAWLKSR